MSQDKEKTYYLKSQESFRILFAGDTSFGENYQEQLELQGAENSLKKFGYNYSLEKLKPLMVDSNLVVVNLETPITDIKNSPFDHNKEYIHYTDIKVSPETLLDHNVSLITLANNHTFDYGLAGLDQTCDILADKMLPIVGAGDNIEQAGTPFIGSIHFGNKIFKFAIIAALEEFPGFQKKYDLYAGPNKKGIMPLNVEAIERQIKKIRLEDPDIFIILFPHWGDNYAWRDASQVSLGHLLVQCGADLIIGHGAHRIQEFEKVDDKWIIFGIGNFMFNSPGRYQASQSPPYSYAASLNIKVIDNNFDVSLNLYPILSDNKVTNYQPRFLNEAEFKDFSAVISNKMPSDEMLVYARNIQRDGYGYYIHLPLISAENNRLIQQKKWIGMIYYDRKRKLVENYLFPYVYRAYVLEHELSKHNYKLISYMPQNFNTKNKTVTGCVLIDNQFKPITVPLPQINYDFYMGPGFGSLFREYEKWALMLGYEIYPGRSFRRLAGDKLRTTELLSKFDQSIVPRTEIFNGEIDQLTTFLKSKNRVFVKPRHGNMGDSILVIKIIDTHYLLEHYINAKKELSSFDTLKECLDHIKANHNNEPYIIQEAIDVIKYEGSVFDVRVNLFSENERWHFTTEIRLGAKASEVSNIAQGGTSHVAEEFLLKLFSDPTLAMLQKIKQTTTAVAQFLNTQCDYMINEIAFDMLIDKSNNLFIAELNAMPGLPGPKEYGDFFHMTENEKHIYETMTLKHGLYLARSLMSRVSQSHLHYPYWFQDLKETADITEEYADMLLRFIFTVLEKGLKKIEHLPTELQDNGKPLILFLSLSDHLSKSTVFLGSGKGLLQALNAVLMNTQDLSPTFTLQSIKLDIVREVIERNDFNIENPLEFDRSLYGLAFDDKLELAYLPQELVIHSIVGADQKLYPERIMELFPLSPHQQIALSKRQYFSLYFFKLQSFYHFKALTTPLYRGHRTFTGLKSDFLLSCAVGAGKYLQNALRENGTFVYEYLPKIDEESNDYNLSRHAGAIYSMLELYEILPEAALLQDIQRALGYLCNQAKPAEDNDCLYIIEDNLISLGTNALALLAISQYIHLTGDQSYLATANKLAAAMKTMQNSAGNFFIHEQQFSTKKNTNFSFPYSASQAIFSLIRFYGVTGEPSWLEMAQKGVNYIINTRDRNTEDSQLTHDQWLLYSLNELHRLKPDPLYIQHTQKICQSMIDAQYQQADPPDYRGSFGSPPLSRPTAQCAEGLCAAYCLMSDNQYPETAQALLKILKLCIQFQLQTQYQPERTYYLNNPQRTLGGFSRSLTDYSIRIDCVSHNISSILGLYKILISLHNKS